MEQYDYDIGFRGRMNLAVVAKSKKDADRILKDTINSITDERFKNLFNGVENIEVRGIDFKTNIDKNKDKHRSDSR